MLVAAPSPCVVPSVHLGPRCRPTSTISRLHAAQSPQKSSCTTNSIEFGCFTLIIDDIVSHDGTTLMGSLGGGGPQTLWGYQVVTGQRGQVALAAGIGDDFPQSCGDWLAQMDCSDIALERIPHAATPRAWQLFEQDGRRTQVWRTPANDALYAMLRPSFDTLPAAFRAARGMALGINPNTPCIELMQRMQTATRAAGGLCAVEPFCPAAAPLGGEMLRAVVSSCDVFSPNELEAASILGSSGRLSTPHDMVAALLDAGASIVALRMGAAGSLVGSATGGAVYHHVPAYQPVQEVDPTGCGNAYVGGMMASLLRGDTLVDAAAWGAAAASCMLEARGVPAQAPRLLHEVARRRQAWVREHVG